MKLWIFIVTAFFCVIGLLDGHLAPIFLEEDETYPFNTFESLSNDLNNVLEVSTSKNNELYIFCFPDVAQALCSYDKLLEITLDGKTIDDKCDIFGTGNTLKIRLLSQKEPKGELKCYILSKRKTCSCGSSPKNTLRIVGGSEALPNEFPSMAALYHSARKAIHCGATIIAQRFCLTAAHCKHEVSDLRLLVGYHDLSKGVSSVEGQFGIKKIIVHPKFSLKTLHHDIALVETDKSMTFSNHVNPACLPFKARPKFGSDLSITGWGSIDFGDELSSKLKRARVQLLDSSKCEEKYKSLFTTGQQICTSSNGSDACQRDSGGPIFYQDSNKRFTLLGIISYGTGCALGIPSVGTNVSYYIPWILDNSKDEEYCREA